MVEPPHARERLLLVTLVAITVVSSVVSSLGAPLVPSIAEKYDTDLATAQWVLSITLLAGAVSAPLLGRLGQGRSQRPAVLISLAIVLLGCVLSAVSAATGVGGLLVMVIGRALQGVGLGLIPVGMAIARIHISPARRPLALAVLSVAMVAGAGLGYPITGWVAAHGGLASAYWLGVALTVLTLGLAAVVVPPGIEAQSVRLDAVGAVLLSLAMIATLLAVSRGNVWGWTAPITVTLGLLGPLGLAVWVVRSLRVAQPLVDLRLSSRPGLLAPNLAAVTFGAGMYFLMSLVMVLAQARTDGWGLGRSVAVAAALLVPYSIGSVGGSRPALALSRTRPGLLLPIGCALYGASTVFLALDDDHLWQAVVAMTIAGVGSGFSFASIPLLMMPHLPADETSSALALNQVLRQLGMTIGSSISVVLMDLMGPGTVSAAGFRNALLTMTSVWVVTGVVLWWLGRSDPAETARLSQ